MKPDFKEEIVASKGLEAHIVNTPSSKSAPLEKSVTNADKEKAI